MHNAVMVQCNRRRWFMQSIHGGRAAVLVVVIASAASAASASPAAELLTKLHFSDVFRAVVHRLQRVFHRRRTFMHMGAAGVA